MVRIAHIENGIVVNVSVATVLQEGDIDGTSARIGDSFINGEFVSPPPAMPTVADYTAAIQLMLDDKARERNYDGILSAASYAVSSHPPFADEGRACADWRDAVWGESYRLMALVQTGQMPQPTIPELLALLPELVWPA